MADLIVVEELHSFLVAEGVGQAPDAAASQTVPSIWVQPREGAPRPRQGEKTTVTITDTLLNGPPGLEPWLEDAFVDIVVRSTSDATCRLLHRTIKGLLHPQGAVGGRKNWTMGALRVLWSRTWKGEQPLPPIDGAVTFDRVSSFRITCARSDLS